MPSSFPTIDGKTIIENMSVRLKSSTVITESRFGFQQQVQDFGGRRWEAEVSIRPLTHTEAMTFSAFLTSLGGVVGTFYLGNPLMTQSASTSITINGNQTINDSTVSMTSANQGAAVPLGHHIEIDGHLHVALTAIPKNATTTVTIEPPLRQTADDGDTVTVNAPRGTWRLADPEVDYKIGKDNLYYYSLSCVEVL